MRCKHLDGIFDEERQVWVCKYCGEVINDVEIDCETTLTMDLRGEKVVIGAKINDRDSSRAIVLFNVKDNETIVIKLDQQQLEDLVRVLSELMS